MSSFKLKGTVKMVGDVQQISESFKKREFVVTENDGQYPQHISFQTLQDRCDLLNDVKVGDEIEVNFNLRGREWTSPSNETKYFNSMDCWSINKISNGTEPVQGQTEEEDDEMPF